MSAAEKAIAALEAAGKAATPGPWGHGEGVCGPYLDFQENDPEWEVNYNGRGPVWLGGSVEEKDRSLIALAVNLSSPLAAVARAAMARRDAIAALRGGVFNESNYRDLQTAKSRVEYCDAKLDAALDALEAAAEGVV